ncbi:MAG: hypothetical protein IPG45_28425 [Deltaproteobacteria bacterium]|nr:hypothetical protein [Deltaproteobacteria bacterium]
MDHALVQHLKFRRAAALSLVALFACARTEHPGPTPPPPPLEIWVSPSGNDQNAGTEQSPLLTIAAALAKSATKIALMPGGHLGDVRLDRAVELRGAGGGAALLLGHVLVIADQVSIEGVSLAAGLSVFQAKEVRVRRGRIEAGPKDEAVALQGARAELSELELSCGPETCLEVATSTVELHQLRLLATSETKRGARIETSSATASDLSFEGGSVAQLQLGRGAKMSLSRSTFKDSRGSGVSVLRTARLEGDQVEVINARTIGAIFQVSQVTLRRLTVGPGPDLAVGVSGGELTLEDPILHAGNDGAINLAAFLDQPPKVSLSGGEIRHGNKGGIYAGSGELRVRGTTFKGAIDPASPTPADAISGTGLGTRLEVEGARFESPSGFAVAFFSDAGGTVTATVTGPGQGGVYAEGIAAAPVLVKDSRIEGCLNGSAVVGFDVRDLTVRGVRAQGCREAAVLAGQGARVLVERTTSIDNPLYGYAAFGGAVLRVGRSNARGSKWALYASCADGADIEDLGGNQFIGATVRCP